MRPGSRILESFLALLLILAVDCARAQTPAPSGDQAGAKTEQGWFARELTHYRAYPHLDMAYRLVREGDKQGAAKELTLYLDLTPGDVKARETLVNLLRELGQGQEALAQADELARRAQDAGQSWLFKGYLAQDQGLPDEAARDFDLAASAASKDSDTYRLALENLAEVRFRQARYQDVLDALARIPQGREGFASVVKRAFALQRLERLREAEEAFAMAVSLAGTPQERVMARRGLAELKMNAGSLDQAREQLLLSLRDEPNDPGALRALALVAAKRRDQDEAVDFARRAVQLTGDKSGQEFLATTLVQAGRGAEAADILRRLADTAPNPTDKAQLLLRLGSTLSGLGHWPQAEQAYREALSAGAGAEAAAGLSVSLEKQGLDAKALDAARSAGEDNPSADQLRRMAQLASRTGATAQARRYAMAAWELAPSRKTALESAVVLEQSGAADEAIALCRKALALPSGQEGVASSELLEHVANLLARMGRNKEASEAFAQAYEADPRGRSEDLLRASRAALEAGLPEASAGLAERYLTAKGPAAGEGRYTLGLALFQAKRWSQALEAFKAAQKIKPVPQTSLAIARCYVALGKPGLGMNELQALEPQASRLTIEERWQYFAELGNLAATDDSWDVAMHAYPQALAIRGDNSLELRLARVERLAGRTADAWKRIERLLNGEFPPGDKALCLEEAAKLRLAGNDPRAAAGFLRRAVEVESNADRQHLLAKVFFDTGWYREAEGHYRQSLAHKEQGFVYADLGFCLERLGKDQEAVQAWDKALALDPNVPNIQEDAAYALKRQSRNPEAVERFKAVIDQAREKSENLHSEALKNAETIYRLRKEVSKMEERLSLTGYLGYFTAHNQPALGTGGQSSFFSPTSNTVEAAFTPPVIGFRDERVFQLIGRLNWQNQPDSLDIDAKSWQGAVGVRYKPLKSYNVQVGFERLFKIGENGENNWLARLMGSWANGYDLAPFRTNWNYTTLFGEADRYLDTPSRWLFAGEVRQGWSFKLLPAWVLTPFAVCDAHVWSPDDSKSSFVEGGLGLSLKYYFNQTEYSAYRSFLELMAQYKAGELYNRSGDKRPLNGLTVSALVRF